MLGLALTVIVTAVSAAPAYAVPAYAPPAIPSASVTCPEDPASCDAATVPMWAPAPAPATDPAEGAGGPYRYATPAVIDCRAPTLPTVLLTLIGECDGTPRDASYRASRFPESEQSDGSVAPRGEGAGRSRRAQPLSACDGVPRDGGDLTVSSPQPLALFSLPGLCLDEGAVRAPIAESGLCSRTLDPLERPPRA